jgi:lysyl-tRNA synthetase class 2
LQSTRSFFAARGFVEVETPALVPSPGLDVHLDAFETNGPRAARYLATSPEYQMKRLLADGAPRIFQIGRAYRRDEQGERHNVEFTLCEFYRAPGAVDDVIADTEQLIARLTGGEVRLGARRVRTLPPFRRITVDEAFVAYARLAAGESLHLAETDEDAFFRMLVDQVEPALAALDEAVILHEYPASQASLARKKPGDPRVAERFEIYVAGVELCNGFGELTDAHEQRARFEADRAARAARGLPAYPLDERFLQALEHGLPDAAGNAIGMDRVIALCLGTTEIAAGLAFPLSEL